MIFELIVGLLICYIGGYLIYPYFRIKNIQKSLGDEVEAVYYPFAGNFIRLREDMKIHGDAFYSQK
jgi:hypothetical protein